MVRDRIPKTWISGWFLSICFLLPFSFCNIIPGLQKQESNHNNLLLGLAAYTYLTSGNCETGGDIWARNIQTQTSYCVPVELVASQPNVEVYRQKNLSVNYDLQAFAVEFNDQTYPKLVSAFGAPSDVDKNGKIKILVLDIIDGAKANTSYVAGFYDPINYFQDQKQSSLRSNYAEVLYLDGKELIDSLVRDPTAFSSTAAHEFQHLIRYPFMVETRATDDLWINEGTSEVASDIAGFGPQKYRIECYRGTDSARCPNGANGVSLLNWSNQTNSSTILKQYALAYVYMRYIYDISGSTDAERNSFFKKTVQGNSIGIRAGYAGQLMTVLRDMPAYNSGLLGTTDTEAFFRTFMLLMGQTSAATNFSNVERVTATSPVTTSIVDLSGAYAAYPLGTNLADLITTPVVASNSSVLTTGSANIYASNFSSFSTLPYMNIATVKNSGNTRTVLAWGAYSASSTSSIRELTATKESAESRYKSLITEGERSEKGALPLCGTGFINDEFHNVGSIPVEPPASKNDNTP